MQGDFFIKDWLVQPQTNTVEKGSHQWHLEPKVMQVLVQLALHSNQVLPKERLIEIVWHDTFVGDDVLIRCISEIRYVFGDDARSPTIIQTIPKSGYRLIAPVTMPVETKSAPNITAEHNYSTASKGIAETVTTITVLENAAPLVGNAPDIPEPKSSPSKPLLQTANSQHRSRRAILLTSITLLAVLVATASIILWMRSRLDPYTAFWSPVLDTPEPALFCIADQNQYSFITLRDANDLTRQVVLKDNLSAVVIDDLDTIVQVAASLHARGKNYLLKGEEKTSLSDLRTGPAIFIGAFDNAWTLRLTKQLRYHFVNNADMTFFRIVDARNPSAPGWFIDRTQQLATNNYQDFAIVARFVDSNTGRPAVIVAGIGRGGTISAGEFLTNPGYLAQLAKLLTANKSKPNFEVVLSTQIIDGHPGAPRMEAAYFW